MINRRIYLCMFPYINRFGNRSFIVVVIVHCEWHELKSADWRLDVWVTECSVEQPHHQWAFMLLTTVVDIRLLLPPCDSVFNGTVPTPTHLLLRYVTRVQNKRLEVFQLGHHQHLSITCTGPAPPPAPPITNCNRFITHSHGSARVF